MMKRFMGVLAVLACFAMSACGGGGVSVANTVTPGGSSPSTSTGEVTLSIKDAPLSALSSFTLDVTKATLRGAASTSDFQIFPLSGSASSVSIDLLSVQGFNQLLSAVNVPVGAYHSIALEYSSVSAVDNQNVAQNITTPGTTVTGVFSPVLMVSAQSQQAIQVDINLQASVFDLGANNLLFSPVIIVDVLNQPRPLKRFPAVVDSVNVSADSFSAHIVFYGPNASNSGRVTVQCNANTSFNDGNGNVSTGSVASKVAPNDLVEIDGSILNSTVDASAVTLLGRAFVNVNGGGNTGGNILPVLPPIAGPPVHSVAGTLTAVDTNSNTITLTSRVAFGPNGNAASSQNPTLQTIDVLAATSIHRGAQSLALADLVLGNWVHVIADRPQGNNSLQAKDIEETPAFVTGTVSAVAQNAGLNGQDRISFTPDFIDQTPVSQLQFLPNTLDVDVPSPHNFAVNSRIQVIGFFVQGSPLLDAQVGRGGGMMGGGSSTGGGTFPGGGNNSGGVNAPPPPPSRFGFFGEVAQGTSATLDNNGDLRVTLALGQSPMSPNTRMEVVIPANVQIKKTVLQGNSVSTIAVSHSQAVTDLNTGNFALDAVGSKAPVNGVFMADIEAVLVDRTLSNSGPAAGGSGNLPGVPPPPPGGGNGGNQTPPNNVIVSNLEGVMSGTASINSNGQLEFSMTVNAPNLISGVVKVIVDANRTITVFDRPSSGGNAPGGGNSAGGNQMPPRTISIQQAVAELNANPQRILASGALDIQQKLLTPVTNLVIFK